MSVEWLEEEEEEEEEDVSAEVASLASCRVFLDAFWELASTGSEREGGQRVGGDETMSSDRSGSFRFRAAAATGRDTSLSFIIARRYIS